MRVTQPKDPIFLEPCNAVGLHPAGFFSPPSRFVEPDTENRLITPLRNGARLATSDVQEALVEAVIVYLDGDRSMALALADLCVSGRAAWAHFRSLNPNDGPLRAETVRTVGLDVDASRLNPAVGAVLDRAYNVAWALHQGGNRNSLGWIAVWAEIDAPYRPVNVPGTRHSQINTTVAVQPNALAPGRSVATRYTVYSRDNTPPEVNVAEMVRGRRLPGDFFPVISEDARLLVFVHGHSSRLEEADLLGEAMNDHPFTVISMDLPCNGYADMFDHIALAPDTDTDTTTDFPLLDFIEQYVLDFVTTVGDQLGRPIHNQVAAFMGGSLGGNISLRLAKRDFDHTPWIHNFIAWSPASVWTPYTELMRETGPNTARARMQQRDFAERRGEYVRQVFDDSVRILGVKPQGDYWYRDDGWDPCKSLFLAGAREERREIYSENYRRWHWRVALEQMLFSHREPHSRLNGMLGRVLLMAAEGDDYPWTHIHDSSRDMAILAINTPGTLRRLRNTGHSIHAERPRHLAQEIATFLPFREPINSAEDRAFIGWIPIAEDANSEPAVISNEDGRLEVFVRRDGGRIWHATQVGRNAGWRRNLVEMRDGLDDDDTLGTFNVQRNWDGRLEIFAWFEKHGWVAHAWQNSHNGSWHDWDKGSHRAQLIGGAADGVFAIERFGEAPSESTEDGWRFDVGRRWLLVGARLASGRIHIRGQNNYGWWTNGRNLGQDSINFAGLPYGSRLASGLLIIFARDDGGRMWAIRETSADNWQSEWVPMTEGAITREATAALDARQRLMVVVRTASGALQLRREIWPGGDWGPWEPMDASIAAGSTPVIIRNPWGELQLYVRWSDGSIRTRRQGLGRVRTWTEWTSLGGNAQFGPVLAPQANGMPIIFHVGTDNQLYYSLIADSNHREVTAVQRADGRITHLCNESADWSPLSVDDAIDEILSGAREYFVVTPEGLRNRIIPRQIVTTTPDDTEDNNLSNLPVQDPGSVGWPAPADDLTERRVTHVLKYGGDSLLSIRGLGNEDGRWSVDRLVAFGQIRAGSHNYFIETDAERTPIIARQYLTTWADSTEANNLDALPDC